MARNGAIALLVLAAALPASAAQKKRLAFAPLRAGGAATPENGQRVAEALYGVARKSVAVVAHFDLVDPRTTEISLVDVDSKGGVCFLPGAAPADCFKKRGETLNVDVFVTGAATLDATQLRVDVHLFAGRGGGEGLVGASEGASVSLPVNAWENEEQALEGALVSALRGVEPALAPPRAAAPTGPEPAPPNRQSGMRYAAWGTAVAAAVAFGAGGYFLLTSNSLVDDLDQRFAKQGVLFPADLADVRSMRRQQTAANVLFGVGAALGVASGAFFYVDGRNAMLVVRGEL